MSNIFHNHLVLKTAHSDVKPFIKGWRSQIEAISSNVLTHEIDNPDDYILSMEYTTTTRQSPDDVYKEIEDFMTCNSDSPGALEATATWTDEGDDYDNRYMCTFDGTETSVIETNLTYSKEKTEEAARHAAERDAVPHAIRTLEAKREEAQKQITKLRAKCDAIGLVIDELDRDLIPF